MLGTVTLDDVMVMFPARNAKSCSSSKITFPFKYKTFLKTTFAASFEEQERLNGQIDGAVA